jgi:hypothetical protein
MYIFITRIRNFPNRNCKKTKIRKRLAEKKKVSIFLSVSKSWTLWILPYSPSVLRKLPSERCHFVQRAHMVHFYDNTYHNFYLSVTILFFLPPNWAIFVPSADMLTRHSDCGSYKLCLQPFSRCFSYKIVAHLIHVLCTLARTTGLVQFIEIETQRCGLKKRGKWRQNVQVRFYVRAFIWSWRDIDK